jgi:hypothetical protein
MTDESTTNGIPIRLADTFGACVPMRGGVPFPMGVLRSAESVQMRDPSGSAVPFDAEAIAFWPDGSIRWLRLDFVAPTNTNRLTLHYGDASRTPPAQTINVDEDDEAFRIDTGVLTFELGKRSFGILQDCILTEGSVRVLDPSGIDLITRDYFRIPFVASKGENYSCELEERGEVHAVFKISGAHSGKRGKLFDYELRLYCWAGSPAVRITYVLKSRQDDELPLARAVEIGIPLAESPESFSAGIERRNHIKRELAGGVSLFQTGPTRMTPSEQFRFALNGNTIASRSEGWVSAWGTDIAVTAVVRRFPQQHPKGFRIDPGGLSIDLWPEASEKPMVLPCGCEKTYDVMLIFHRPGIDVEPIAEAFAKPAVLICSPNWYCETGAVSKITPAKNSMFPEFERIAEGAFAALKKRRMRLREYGDFDYGDFADEEERDRWTNVEYDTPYALLTQFVRTGKRDYLDWGLDAALHQGDIDIAHYVPTDPGLVGSQSIHATGHLGRESKWFYYRTDHIWAQGLVCAYWLTGDRRYLENALLVGDYLAHTPPCPDDGGAERPYAWSLIGLVAVYEATLDAKYLGAARSVAESVLARSHPYRGLWLREWNAGSERQQSAGQVLGNSPFMAGLLLEGLIDYNDAASKSRGMLNWSKNAELVRDSRIEDFIVKSVRTLISEAWVEEDGSFYYNPASGGRGRPADPRQLLGLLRAYEITGDRDIIDVATKHLAACIRVHLASLEGEQVKGGADRNAKNYAILMRTLPRVIAANAIRSAMKTNTEQLKKGEE